jgi:hypothetical protein
MEFVRMMSVFVTEIGLEMPVTSKSARMIANLMETVIEEGKNVYVIHHTQEPIVLRKNLKDHGNFCQVKGKYQEEHFMQLLSMDLLCTLQEETSSTITRKRILRL